MDPITLIIKALIEGAAKAASGAVPDAYNALKKLIKDKFASKDKAGAAYVLDQHEKEPEMWDKPLQSELLATQANKDEEIIAKAKEILKELKPKEFAAGEYNLNVKGNFEGIAAQEINNSQLNLNFNTPSKESD